VSIRFLLRDLYLGSYFSQFEGEFNLPSGPYQKPLERFIECLDKRLEKDQKYTLHQVSAKCEINEQTVQSYVYQNLGEVNKYMAERGKKVRQVEIVKEFRGLVVDPPGTNNAGLFFGLLGLTFFFLLTRARARALQQSLTREYLSWQR